MPRLVSYVLNGKANAVPYGVVVNACSFIAEQKSAETTRVNSLGDFEPIFVFTRSKGKT